VADEHWVQAAIDFSARHRPSSMAVTTGIELNAPRTSCFWLTHAIIPGVLVGAILAALLLGDLDPRIARQWAYDPVNGWIGAQTWWAVDLIHTWGRNFVRLMAGTAVLAWAASFVSPKFRSWRRGGLYIALAIIVSTGVAGLLKSLTNVDCPWDLEPFGGKNPYVALFAHRPDHLPRAQCFPGAHSSSGFALMSCYFLLRNRSRRAARMALAGGLLIGTVFALGQQARGAHFLSHDLTSAAIVWYVLLGLYLVMFARRAE
jgi:membrane-associated PAP2 superfamily phosphatase